MRKTYVHPSGNNLAEIAIVDEQPRLAELRTGRNFADPIGKALDSCLYTAKLVRSSLYFTHVVKDLDAPLSHYINISVKGSSISLEGNTYINELGRELKALPNLKCVVALGNISMLALTNRIGITKWRGSVIESTVVPGLKVIPTYHPSSFTPPRFSHLNKPLLVSDLLKAKEESKFKEIRRLPRDITIRPSFQECLHALNYIYEVGLRGQTIDIDIEVINGELDCFALAWQPDKAICIPLRWYKGDYFTVDEELQIMKLLAAIIEDERISIRGANFIFDTQFLLHKYGIVPNGPIHCTQIAQKIAFPDYPAGLDFVTTMHTDIPYYKADGKQWIKMGTGDWDTWWNYNGLDAIATAAAHPRQTEDLIKQGNIQTYERQRALIKPLIYMSERGIKIDVQGLLNQRDKEKSRLSILAEQLNSIVGYEINYNSPKQLMNYFYKELNIQPYKKRNTKGQSADTIDVDALKRLSRRGYEAAQIMLDIRSLAKRTSTYMNIGKVDTDGRYRSSYKPVGASTGRIASGETIFGTGGNQQNWPHDLLRYFLFDEGYIGYAIDLSQIENRIVAYCGGVIEQIRAFESGIDLHRLTASIILSKPYNEVSDEDGSSVLGDGRQSERFWGKKGNHATNYDVGHKTFALKNEMTEIDAKVILNNIHRGYPQIRNGYHLMIQNMLKANRTVVNLMDRHRLFLGPVIPAYPNTTACLDTYREAYAHFAQSSCADKINEHGVGFIYNNQDKFRSVELLTQIHDSVVFQIPLTLSWREHAVIISEIKKSLETPFKWKDSYIHTPADVSVGLNMCKEDMKELKHKNFPTGEEALAIKLEEIYNGLTTPKGMGSS